MSMVSLIVMEAGSEWPGHVRDSENIVAVGQGSHEGLVVRTRRTLDLLRASGKRVRVAVLACSSAIDEAAVACRTQLSRDLLDAVTLTGFGRLVLSSAAHPSRQLRSQLLSLAGTLSHQVVGTTVRVRFDEGAPAIREGTGADTELRRLLR